MNKCLKCRYYLYPELSESKKKCDWCKDNPNMENNFEEVDNLIGYV